MKKNQIPLAYKLPEIADFVRRNAKFLKKNLSLVFILSTVFNVSAQQNKNNTTANKDGYSIIKQNENGLSIRYSMKQFEMTEHFVNGILMKTPSVAGMFLPNEAGAPNLPNNLRYIALPQGAEASLQVISYDTETITNVEIAPAPVIPLDLYDNPLVYEKDKIIYNKNEFYPKNPVILFDPHQIRGVDATMLGITPFQYNPVTKTLIVYKNIELEIKFTGGNGHFGNDAFRSRWWDPLLEDMMLNSSQLPVIDYNAQLQEALRSRATGCEYAIIIPTGPDFVQWADSVKKFRTEQGIYTQVYTLTDIGSTTAAGIKTWVNNAYNTWTIKPAAMLILADYGSNAASTVISNLYPHDETTYPDFASDNYYADVTGDNLPDIAFSRILANTAAQLKVMCTKFLNYERNPPTTASFYDKPLTAVGWQDDRWFQLGGEIVGGYLKSINKTPTRVNATGSPASNTGSNTANTGTWSTASNTATMISYFGTAGLQYIPDKPGTLGGFSGGGASGINSAINAGTYMVLHRDHGYYGGWGEPSYSTTSISSLTNVGTKLPFVFSVNCETGAFHRTSDCFAEKFHRYTYNSQNSGALGMIAATETSYSFVNDVFIFGMFDNMWANFMPAYGTTPASRDMRPAFGNVAGKYFLKQSSWCGSSSKLITYRLFHMLGDAFQWFYSEVPQNLSVTHNTTVANGATTFAVSATAGSFISITQSTPTGPIILGTATGTGSSVNIPLSPAPTAPLLVTVTKQNYFRYGRIVNIGGTTSVSDLSQANEFILYPNPANNTFTIEGQAHAGKVKYTLYDITGREVKSGNVATNSEGFKEVISINTLSAGTYFVRVSDEVNSWMKKLNIE